MARRRAHARDGRFARCRHRGRSGDVTIVQDDNTNGCNGVVTTPGSENTLKTLVGGTLEPGGTAEFIISFPVDAEDVTGREEFEITDCVFIGDEAVLKFFISFVPNTEDFELELR